MSAAPLDGILVVAMEQAVAAPFATRQLADLGARVIKLERPGTGDFARGYDGKVDGLSSAFLWLNRGKESVELDAKSADGRRLLDALLGRADVFLHNISPSAAARLGIDSATLSTRFPRLIAGSVSGYGTRGPLADAKAYDLLVQGETGLISLTGGEDSPAKVGISIADISAGMYAYASVLAAIHHRSRTGEALPVDVSLFDSLTEWLLYPMYYTAHGGAAPRRMGASHATIAPYGPFTTGDGAQVLLAVQNEREWVRFCAEVVRMPELAEDPRFGSQERRVGNRDVLDAIIADRLAGLDRDTVLKRLDAADIASGRLNPIERLPDHEQLAGRWTRTGTQSGPVSTVLPPWAPPGIDGYGDVPGLGQHTAAVRDWLGLNASGAEGKDSP
ncbi:CaiB/BaiF CoA transferase family protein [Pseudonocardia pini]|uniref:CaiB/BaiF CoA transferase family protein n=1 Tax=Pseudonocardia pini TaxID=2758030 RepID=UPI0015F06262|nr:CaiB/BaiF CoA-transferase family protein [Pseudonocardia pini]